MKKSTENTLNILLADLHVVYVKTRNYHWNVKGMYFQTLHTFFQTIYTQLELNIDDLAERIQSLGGFSIGSLEEYVALARLKDEKRKGINSKEMLTSLSADFDTLIASLKKDISGIPADDLITVDFLTGLLDQFEKTAWMIKAHIE